MGIGLSEREQGWVSGFLGFWAVGSRCYDNLAEFTEMKTVQEVMLAIRKIRESCRIISGRYR